jgi:HEAT repeat protein
MQKRFTMPGTVMGTPTYMSPEQAQGMTLDGRSDQYALGCILYEMLCGAVPFDSDNPSTVLLGHITREPDPPSRRLSPGALSHSLEKLVLRLLAKQPKDRYASMAEVGEHLQREMKRLQPRSDPGVAGDAATTMATRAGRPMRRRWLLPLFPASLVLMAFFGYGGYRLLTRPPDNTLPARELAELRQRALGVLTAQLRRPEKDVRLRALSAIGQTHDAALRTLLEPLLSEPETQIQSRAAEALGLLGDRGAAPALLATAEKTPNPVVRVAAAGALDQLGDARGPKILHAALVSEDEEARLRAAFLLCSSGEKEAQVVLRDWLGRGTPPDELLVNVLYRLASAGDVAAHDKLLSRLERGGRPEVQLSTAASLARLGDERGRTFLHEAARRAGKEQVLAARLVASQEGSGDLDLFRQIIGKEQASPAARVTAVEGLADAGQSIDARALLALLDDQDLRLRQAAASGIMAIIGRDPAALSEQSLSWAEDALMDSDWTMRGSAVATLGDVPSNTVSLLKKVLATDSEPRVRRAAARALAARPERDALLALHDGLSDANADVRKETLRALARLGQRLRARGDASVLQDVQVWLKPLLDSAEPSEQLLASGALYRLGDEMQRSRLSAGLSASEEVIRRLALEELERDADLLAPLLRDATPAVQLLAARKLAALGDRRAIPVLTAAAATPGIDGLSAYALLRKLGVTLPPPKDLDRLILAPDVKTRLSALDAAAALPLSDALTLLLTTAHDAAAEVRRRSGEIAAELPHGADNQPGGLPVLRILVSDSDAGVRMRAAALLARLLKPAADSAATSTQSPHPPRPAVVSSRPSAPPVTETSPPDGGTTAPEVSKTAEGPAEGPIEQYLAAGLEAYNHKDYKKAQKQLERAGALCAKQASRFKQCVHLSSELAYELGQVYEAQEQWANAAAEYQKLLPPLSKGRSQRQAAAAAMNRLSSRLGRIEIGKQVDGRCEHVTLWMPPGLHRVNLGNGQSKFVQVQANETVDLNNCSQSN